MALNFYVKSTRLGGKTYKINKIIEYRVELNLETDSDGFEFVVGNINGELNGVISKFDFVKITLNGNNLMKGVVDDVLYNYGNDGSTITVTGRDLVAILVDNDALPQTLENINCISYITNRCNAYNIKYKSYLPISKRTDLSIGTGESEISIMNNLLIFDKQRMWYFYDTLYSGTWNTGASAKFSFIRGVDKDGIRIESLSLDEDGRDVKSEIIIYGSVKDGKESVVGTAKNPYLVDRGIVRRETKRSSDNDSTTRYSASALKEVRESLRDNTVIRIKAYTKDNFLVPNNTANVIDKISGINGKFFIQSISYTKSVTDGSVMDITMIPNDSTFDIMWRAQSKGNSLTDIKKK